MTERTAFSLLLHPEAEEPQPARPPRVSVLRSLMKPFADLGRTLVAGTHRTRRRRMSLVDTISLGERRFVAVVQIDSREFLIAGSSGSVTLLSQWDKSLATEEESA